MSLDQAFQRALAAERNVIPRPPRPANTQPPSGNSTSSNPTLPTPNQKHKDATWCTFHKSNYHSSKDCRVLKARHCSPKTLFVQVTPSMDNDYGEVVELTNPTELDLSLIIMTSNDQVPLAIPLFTYNFQIKNVLATFILDNGSHKNLDSDTLVERLNRTTTSHPQTYHLGWVQKEAPRMCVSQQCIVTFVTGPFCDTVTCDVAPLDCVDTLVGIPYQQESGKIKRIPCKC